MSKPSTKPKPWVAVILQCPQDLHRLMKSAAAEEHLTLQAACFVAFREYVQQHRPEARPAHTGGETP
jgi:hypothetical protein